MNKRALDKGVYIGNYKIKNNESLVTLLISPTLIIAKSAYIIASSATGW